MKITTVIKAGKNALIATFGYHIYSPTHRKSHFCIRSSEVLEWMQAYEGFEIVVQLGGIDISREQILHILNSN